MPAPRRRPEPGRGPLRADLARRPGHQLPQRPWLPTAVRRGGPPAEALGPRLRAAAPRAPLPLGSGRPSARDSIDVTEHPEVDDLVLAADVAVLDYSSLRFDIGLAGRPMVFFVPDVVRLFRFRRARLPLRLRACTAPGPHVATTEGGGGSAGGPARPRGASGAPGSPSSTPTTTGWPTVGRPSGWWPSSSRPCGRKRRRLPDRDPGRRRAQPRCHRPPQGEHRRSDVQVRAGAGPGPRVAGPSVDAAAGLRVDLRRRRVAR